MTRLIEMAEANISAFGTSAVGRVEILRDSVQLAEANPKLLVDRFYGYYKVIRHLFDLSPEDMVLIARVNQKLGTNRGADRFLEAMGDQRDRILTCLRQMGDLANTDNQQGLDELMRMMYNAWQIRQEEPEWVPADGDQRSDTVIWGFVKGATDPLTDIDFSLCHGIERTLTCQNKTNPFTLHKDWLLCALNDVIALRGLKGQGFEAEVLGLWSTARPGGLGWIGNERVTAFKAELGL